MSKKKRKIVTLPNGATITKRVGYVMDQFVRNVRTLLIERRRRDGELLSHTRWEIGPGVFRCLQYADASVRPRFWIQYGSDGETGRHWRQKCATRRP